ncbi:MAG: hypothetical protein JWL57_1160 [Actinobacteria bacterium]|nr:hypothetical protein [Actinomycetota bacterium]
MSQTEETEGRQTTTSFLSIAERAALWPPAAAAAAYAVVLAVHLRRLVAAVFWNSDVASIPILAGEMAHQAAGVANVSVANYWSTFLFDFATRSFPFHRGIWTGFSLATSFLAVAVLAWAARRAAGKAAGLLVFAIALCASPIAFHNAYELRGPTWLTGALLVACLVGLAEPGSGALRGASGPKERRRRWLAVAVVGVVAGAGLASDPLLLLSGMAPLLGAAVGAWLLLRSPASARVARAAGVLAAVAVLGDVATGRIMRGLGFRIVPTLPIGLAPWSQVPANLELLAHSILAFGNEEFPGVPSGVLSMAGAVTILLCLAAVAAALRLLLPLVRHRRDRDRSLALVLYVLFWALTAVVVCAAFAFSTLPIGDVTSARYVVPVFLAIAGLAGLWAAEAGWPKIAVAVLATVFCVMSTLGIPQVVRYWEAYPLAQEGPALVAYLEAKGLTRGYASYWDALGLMWRGAGKIGVYSLEECAPAGERALCPFNVNTLSTWYRPQPVPRTFLVVGLPFMPQKIADPPPSSLGSPLEVAHVGVFTVYVYAGDVATRLRFPDGPTQKAGR